MEICLLPASDPGSQKTTPGCESAADQSGAAPCPPKPSAARPSWRLHQALTHSQNTRALLSPMLVALLHSPVTVPKGGGAPRCPRQPSLGSTQLQKTLSPCPCSPMGGINLSRRYWLSGPGHPAGPSCCPHVPKPSLGPIPNHGTAAAATQPHLGLIFHAKPHSPPGRRSCFGKAGGSEGNSLRAGSGCGRLTRKKMELEGQWGSAAGWGQRQKKHPRHRSPRPRQEQSRRDPGDAITPSWKHVLPPAQALHDLTTTCLRRGRKRGNL